MIIYSRPEPSDKKAIIDLLSSVELPTADVPAHLSNFIIATLQGVVVGCIGIEIYQADGLLRSFAVKKSLQGQKIGNELCLKLMEYARERNVSNIHLLTSTAEEYFQRLGFTLQGRETSPPTIAKTTEFALLCPSSAKYMVRGI